MEKLRTDHSVNLYGQHIACHWLKLNGKVYGRVLGGFSACWIDEEGERVDAPDLSDEDAATLYRLENP